MSVKKSTKKNNRHLKIWYFLYSLAILLSILFLLMNYSKINALNFELNNSNAIIKEKTNTQMDLQAKIEFMKRDHEIVSEAQNKLGMDYAKDSQIYYISVDTENNESTQTGVLGTLFNTITGMGNN